MISMKRLQNLNCLNRLFSAVLFCLFFCSFPVSAEYAQIVNYGWANVKTFASTHLNYQQSPGNSLTDTSLLFTFGGDWQSSYTYTVVVHFESSVDISIYDYSGLYPAPMVNDTYDGSGVYYTSTVNKSVICTLSGSRTDGYIFTFNFHVDDINFMHGRWYISRLVAAIGAVPVIKNTYCNAEYDPGGTYYDKLYADYLDQIVNAGQGYSVPDQAASDLKDSLGSLDSAEASLSSKAEELRSAGSATMNSAIAASKDLPSKIGSSTSFLTTTFTKFWDAVPSEVTAALLVCAAIIFAGWLIGRIQ